MDNLFEYDNKFFEVLGKITDIIILNLLCIISCLPIITIGASVTATYFVALQMVRNEETYIIREFIKRFKENFILEHVKLLEKAFDKRNTELWRNCNQIYFLADIQACVPESFGWHWEKV